MAKIHINLGSSKKRKRGERVLRFESFCKPGYPTIFDGSFQENLRALLGFGYHEVIVHEGLECWSFRLEFSHNPPTGLKLFVVEEMVGISPHWQCHYCRSVGWGNHMICCKRFHIVLPSKESVSDHGEEKLTIEVNGIDTDQHALRSKLPVNVEDHLMHGILHLNGFGHLICINGFDGGSEFIFGHQIMDFWDRICTGLQVRKVSIIDVAKKDTMELRLIHGLAYGEPWFGRWGYKFGHGSYGITQQIHERSLQALRGFPLSLLMPPLSNTIFKINISTVAAKYQAMSSQDLVTLGDLFHCIMELKLRLPRENPPSVMDFHSIVTTASCRWSMKRLEMAAHVIVQVLKRLGLLRWITRQEVRDASRAFIGDTGLLDFVLKSLGNHIVGNYIVRRMVNPSTKVLEYCLQEISAAFPCHQSASSSWAWRSRRISRMQLKKDMLYLYKHVLMGEQFQPMHATAMPVAINILLDTKHLVKEYNKLRRSFFDLTCVVRLRDQQHHRKSELLPNEIMRVPVNWTVGDLKKEVERYCRSTYWGLKDFIADAVVVDDVVCRGQEEGELVMGVVNKTIGGGGAMVVVIEGRKGEEQEEGGEKEVVFEGGDGEEAVDCICGAKEEDGERMVSCDICEVWQHTRCSRIANGEDVPSVFLCRRCEADIVALPLMQY